MFFFSTKTKAKKIAKHYRRKGRKNKIGEN